MQYGPDGETYNKPLDRRFVGFNKTYVKELCHDPIWISTCANTCYMADPSRPVTGMFGKQTECRDVCDKTEAELTADGPRNENGHNFPPGAARKGYDASGAWYVRTTATGSPMSN